MKGLHIRWSIRRDLPALAELERLGCSRPWSAQKLLAMTQRASTVAMVAEAEGRVVAYMMYDLAEGRIVLRRLAVRPSHRRRGVGRKLLAVLASKLGTHNRRRIVIAVPERNLTAQQFLRAGGFRCVRITHHASGDLYRMRYDLPAVLAGLLL